MIFEGGRMRRCIVDIETFSSVDLAKCGVFKYDESRACCCAETATCATST